MKKFLSVFSIAAVMTACNNNPQALTESAKLDAYKDSIRMAADTAGLADYQLWKAQNELADANQYNSQYGAVAAAKPARSYAPARKASSRSTASKNRSTDSGSTYEGGSMNSESSNTAMRKKGWSKAAKGAAIGAGTGAVAGAVINKKNRVVGAVVGGVAGGAVGFGIGRTMDKRDGRY